MIVVLDWTLAGSTEESSEIHDGAVYRHPRGNRSGGTQTSEMLLGSQQ